ncbi:MAG: 1-(5-phosphoribosyl)-5-[(5- phosphoribosylamino)methylideneamino] imidazole-4-carboxamide [Verrucomicrobiales bacterium]|nr:1-(5-phosphoribosyl)-5-[(5- phosphoribosylamino)methylideneamino] imidazole-4-carboxamide [Verrucomicrobiales bacterium]
MFRPCIDLHQGKVKQIVGSTLSDDPSTLRTNFVSERPGSWFAELYKRDGIRGAHVIMLGKGNEAAARETLAAYRDGLQIGGGISADNAGVWLNAGASHVIVTSWLFPDGQLSWDKLKMLTDTIGKNKLVVDLSCKRMSGGYMVMTDRWQKPTGFLIEKEGLQKLSEYCDEFLVHAVDVEGMCKGVDLELVKLLADWSPIPVTYAGGARSIEDLETVTRASGGKVDLTIGSALDIFGGNGVKYLDAVAYNKKVLAP